MGIDHRCPHVFVAQEFLYGPDVVTVFQKMRGETMSKRVASPTFCDQRLSHSFAHRFLDETLVKMMATLDVGPWIDGPFARRKQILPSPLALGTSECVGKSK